MSYSACDFQDDICAALVSAGLVTPSELEKERRNDDDGPRASAVVCLRAINRLTTGPRKAGIKRIKGVRPMRAPAHALIALALLRNALDNCNKAGACYTAARVRYAISSAKGAVRAAQYRQGRAS